MVGPLSDTVKLRDEIDTPDGVPVPGQVIAGKYRVESTLGVGGMGVVLAVRHITLGELYAMKFLLPKGAQDGEAVARFMREAKAAVRIKSEHIARVNDFGQLESGSPYIVMEHLEGIDLSDLTERYGAQSSLVACDYVIQACAGLAEAHQLGIIHRDLKPSNLFVTRRADGTPLVKVLDFGISKAATDSVLPAITSTTDTFGSPAYMSPEQIRSAKNVDARSDVFSLGVILFELLTARLPFEGETSAGLLAAISADAPLPLSAVRPESSGELEAVIARCLQKNPNNRFPSVSELANALAPFASPESQSLVQRIGRIGSASNVPPPLGSVAPPPIGGKVPSASGPMSAKNAAAAATERPWTTLSKEPGSKRSPVLVIAITAIAVAVLAFAAFMFRGGGFSVIRTTAAGVPSAPSIPSISSPPAATSAFTPTIPSTPIPSSVPTQSSTAVTAAASVSTKPAMDFSPIRRPQKSNVVTHPAPSVAPVEPPVSAAPPPPPPPRPKDPTAESH